MFLSACVCDCAVQSAQKLIYSQFLMRNADSSCVCVPRLCQSGRATAQSNVRRWNKTNKQRENIVLLVLLVILLLLLHFNLMFDEMHHPTIIGIVLNLHTGMDFETIESCCSNGKKMDILMRWWGIRQAIMFRCYYEHKFCGKFITRIRMCLSVTTVNFVRWNHSILNVVSRLIFNLRQFEKIKRNRSRIAEPIIACTTKVAVMSGE